MENFSLQWRNSTKKDLRSIPNQEVERIVTVVTQLASEPFPQGSQKLAGAERTYRIRVGDYRVIYEVYTVARMIEIQRVRHRKDVYR